VEDLINKAGPTLIHFSHSKLCLLSCSTTWIFDSFIQTINDCEFDHFLILCFNDNVSEYCKNSNFYEARSCQIVPIIQACAFVDKLKGKYTSIDLFTDNEFRLHELKLYRILYEGIAGLHIFDHGCKNSQDARFIEYLTTKRVQKNAALLYKIGLINFARLKLKRIYYHSRDPIFSISPYLITGYLALKQDLKCLPHAHATDHKILKKDFNILLLTNGSERYSYKLFSCTTLSLYHQVIKHLLYQGCSVNLYIKSKPRESLDFKSFPFLDLFNINIQHITASSQLSEVLKQRKYATIYTSIDSITFASLHILGYNVIAYRPLTPLKFRLTSWHENSYKKVLCADKKSAISPLKNMDNFFFFSISPSRLSSLLVDDY